MRHVARRVLNVGVVLTLAGCGASGTPAPAPSSAASPGVPASTAPASATGPAVTVSDACTLITDAEIAAVTGFTPADHSSAGSACQWEAMLPGQNVASPLFDITVNQTATATVV
jgi:Protein of unknown function (DUF3558)